MKDILIFPKLRERMPTSKDDFTVQWEDGSYWIYRNGIPFCMIPDTGEPGDTAEEDAVIVVTALILSAWHEEMLSKLELLLNGEANGQERATHPQDWR